MTSQTHHNMVTHS